jgi:hypothetical protein
MCNILHYSEGSSQTYMSRNYPQTFETLTAASLSNSSAACTVLTASYSQRWQHSPCITVTHDGFLNVLLHHV